MVSLLEYPELVRNVVVVGHLHHGKTSLVDMLMNTTHTSVDFGLEKNQRYTDQHLLERARGFSIKMQPVSVLLPDQHGKSWVFNVADTPGHVNFVDEVAAGVRVADGAVLVVDAVEGLMCGTEQVIQLLARERLPMVLVINKVERLIMELKLPLNDAYFKLRHTLEEVNACLRKNGLTDRFSPDKGNVLFASSLYGWCFSLQSFAKMYADTCSMDPTEFSKRLWGDVFFNPDQRTFTRKPTSPNALRSFVHFILGPLYKLYSHCLSFSKPHELAKVLRPLRIFLKPADYKQNVAGLLRTVLQTFFGPPSAFVDVCVEHLPSPVQSTKIHGIYTGSMASPAAEGMMACNKDGPLVIQVVKLYPSDDATRFDAFGRVWSGTVRLNDKVRVLGENYSLDDEEDMSIQHVSNLEVYVSRYRIQVDAMPAGSWVLLSGVDMTIVKTATLVHITATEEERCICRPLTIPTTPVIKLAIEPINPSELPKMLDGLRKINKTYPLVSTRVEESGEHVILGTGEMYMDCIMHDLRTMYAQVDIKVADPVVRFCETVVETSMLKCFAETPNRKNRISMIAEPLEKEVVHDVEQGLVDVTWPVKQMGQWFEQHYQWDLLASRSIWAFGPTSSGPNALLNDTISGEVDKKLLMVVKESIKQGFQWATREGPLCDEPMRSVKFKIIHCDLANEPIYRGSGQVIPTTRRVCYSSFLTAAPRLMEPVYHVEVQAPADCVSAVYTVLARRRGHVTQDIPKAGSPLYTIKALLPVIDSFGFETDLRTHTQGQAFCQQVFDHWQVVPGDPLDKTIVLRPLEPSPAPHLARDFMLKTRRRKGLSEDVTVNKYFEHDMLLQLSE
jgi:U5 small nuclear ribonucleoprotein component